MTIDEFMRLDQANQCKAVAVSLAQDMEGRLLVTSGMLARVEVGQKFQVRQCTTFRRTAWMELDD